MAFEKEKNKLSWGLVAVIAILIVIGLVAYSRKQGGEIRPGEELLPKREQLTTEEILKRLSAPATDKPFKPDPELLKKLSAPEK